MTTLRLTDPIVGVRPEFDPTEILDRLDRPDAKDKAFLASLVKWCAVAGVDPAVPAAQWLLETDNARSPRWNDDLNASGMGIVADATAQPFYIPNVDASARLFVQCLYALVTRQRHPGINLWVSTLGKRGGDEWFSTVWLPKVQSSAMPDVRTVGDLGLRYVENGQSRATWSWEDGKRSEDAYGMKLISRLSQFYPALPDPAPLDPPVETPSTPAEPVEQEPAMAVPATLDYSSLSFPVEIRLIRPGQTMQRPGYAMTPTRTTWHDTGNPAARADARSHAVWMEAGCPDANGNPTYTSWHFSVDDGRAIQHIPLNEVAWHAGDGGDGPGNRTSIAIEECVNRDRDALKTRANAAELHAFLIRELGLQGGTIAACVQHNYWSGKNCPEVIRNAGLWPEMQRQMQARLGAKPPTPVYADAAPVAKGSRVLNGYVFLAPGGKTVQTDVIPSKYADKDQPATGPALTKGTKIAQEQIGHYVVGTDGALWVELVGVPGVKDGSRIPALALIGESK